MVFLSGPTNLGPGKTDFMCDYKADDVQELAAASGGGILSDTAEVDNAEMEKLVLGSIAHRRASRSFYEEAAVAAASQNVCVDMFILCSGAVGLSFMQPLFNSTGGVCYCYPDLRRANLAEVDFKAADLGFYNLNVYLLY